MRGHITSLALLLCVPYAVLGACNFAKTVISTAPGFDITVTDTYKILNDTTAGIAYGLYCDNQQPSNVDGVAKWFKVPVTSVGTRIPLASGFLEALGQRDKLTAAEAPANLTNICIDKSKMQTLDNSTNVGVVFSSNASSDGAKSVRLPSDDSLTPLQKAEWIKFVAAFFNAEPQASALFDDISAAYS
ncbi:hypothetical protein GGI04_005926, partial [Coemansia thaxteri]